MQVEVESVCTPTLCTLGLTDGLVTKSAGFYTYKFLDILRILTFFCRENRFTFGYIAFEIKLKEVKR